MLNPAMAASSPTAIAARVGSTEDAATVAELYDRHHDAVRSFARRLVGDEASAEDLVHEVFLRLPDALRCYRGDAPLRTLILGMAVHIARKHIRSAARRRAALVRAAEHVAKVVSTPEQEVAQQELASALHRALDAIPIHQRVAFVLIEIEERSSVEAASIAEVPESTMRTRLLHAKRRLREILRKRGIV
jgi:RNA polymerase sigma-70 factor (ECF subfamily)